jgi:hypothetical protein
MLDRNWPDNGSWGGMTKIMYHVIVTTEYYQKYVRNLTKIERAFKKKTASRHFFRESDRTLVMVITHDNDRKLISEGG